MYKICKSSSKILERKARFLQVLHNSCKNLVSEDSYLFFLASFLQVTCSLATGFSLGTFAM